MTPQISVVVPTYHRTALLKRCLAALLRQNLPAGSFEIIVVHDGPDPATHQLIADWRRRLTLEGGPNLRYLEPVHGGPAAARNAGWRAAAADLVAFTDDDTMPEPGWLRAALGAFTDDLDAAWGPVSVPLPESPTDYELDSAGLASGRFVTANCFCRRRILVAIGGFDTRFGIAWREDSDLHFRLLKRGARLRYLPEARVVHPLRPGTWGVSLRQQKKVLYDALLFKKHRQLYRRWIRSTPRRDYYAMVAALIAALAGGAADMAWMAWGSGLVWLAMTARFFLLRVRPASKRISHVAEMLVTSMLIPPVAVFWRLVGALRFRVVFL